MCTSLREHKLIKTKKMGRNKIDLGEDESLAEEVRKYKCLYDKSSADYKDKFKNKNAWREVETVLGYSPGICYFIHDKILIQCINNTLVFFMEVYFFYCCHNLNFKNSTRFIYSIVH